MITSGYGKEEQGSISTAPYKEVGSSYINLWSQWVSTLKVWEGTEYVVLESGGKEVFLNFYDKFFGKISLEF